MGRQSVDLRPYQVSSWPVDAHKFAFPVMADYISTLTADTHTIATTPETWISPKDMTIARLLFFYYNKQI